MRKSNSKFETKFLSEAGSKLENRDYFGYVELDGFACYVLADSLDDDTEKNSAKIAVESVIRSFGEHPSMGKQAMNGYLKTAHKELQKESGGMRLKASLMLVVTNYVKLRYAAIGNSRFYLMRNERILIQSKDQSLTRNLLDDKKLELDKAALHEERNNLYAYLGREGNLNPQISKKFKLEDGDLFAILTRGIWEYCDNGEFLDASQDAKEPQEILDSVEELILSKQPLVIDNYTISVTFINKIYRNPKKRWTVKKVLLMLLPIVLIVGTIGLVWYFKQRSIRNKTESMEQYITSGEKYIEYNNYQKAAVEYEEAGKLAKSLKREQERMDLDRNLKAIDQILLGDTQFQNEDYQKSMDTYLEALELSYDAGNLGKEYIEDQLKKVQQYIEVFDLLNEGEQKEEYDDIEGAIGAYEKAKELSVKLYYKEGKQEAVDKIAAIEKAQMEKKKEQESKSKEEKQQAEEQAKAEEETLKKEVEEELKALALEQELQNQERLNEQKNAIELENKGNQLVAGGEFQNALTYYQTAVSIYGNLEMQDRVDALLQKIQSTQGLIQTNGEQ